MSLEIKVLKELTDNMGLEGHADLSEITKRRGKNNGVVEYEVEEGNIFGFGLFKNEEVAIQRVFLSSDSVMPKHIHDEIEYIIIYRGEVEITSEDTKNLLKTGDFIVFPPHKSHKVVAIQDSWAICITIPASEMFPDGGN